MLTYKYEHLNFNYKHKIEWVFEEWVFEYNNNTSNDVTTPAASAAVINHLHYRKCYLVLLLKYYIIK